MNKIQIAVTNQFTVLNEDFSSKIIVHQCMYFTPMFLEAGFEKLLFERVKKKAITKQNSEKILQIENSQN